LYHTASSDNKDGLVGVYLDRALQQLSFLPKWARKLIPADKFVVRAQTWNEHPVLYSTYSVPFLGERVSLSVETRCVDNDSGDLPNALNLDVASLASRTVHRLDICDDDACAMNEDAIPANDPKVYISKKLGRGPLKGDWEVCKWLVLLRSVCSGCGCVWLIADIMSFLLSFFLSVFLSVFLCCVSLF
jgi:Phosphatidylinositol transfer protein